MGFNPAHLAAINKNRRASGKFGPWSRDAPNSKLRVNRFGDARIPVDETEAFRARIDQLASNNWVPAARIEDPFDPASTEHRDEWWQLAYANAEQKPTGSVLLMPDDYTPGMTGGHAISGHRRTHRMRYQGGGVDLRMPSVTAIRRYAEEVEGRTFDVPVEVHHPDGTFHGYVRVTRGKGGIWEVEALGTDKRDDEHAYVTESVRSVLEGRRPRLALGDGRDLLMEHRLRYELAGSRSDMPPKVGVLVAKERGNVVERIGYNRYAGEIVLTLGNGKKSYTYGYLNVDPQTASKINKARSPMDAYNYFLRGKGKEHPRFEVEQCANCGRFANVERGHLCHFDHDRGSDGLDRRRAMVLRHITGTSNSAPAVSEYAVVAPGA